VQTGSPARVSQQRLADRRDKTAGVVRVQKRKFVIAFAPCVGHRKLKRAAGLQGHLNAQIRSGGSSCEPAQS
jgi:hypothetical protein